MLCCFWDCRLEETLEIAEDMAIDIPHIWLYLAELITPVLHEGGIPMGQLFRWATAKIIESNKSNKKMSWYKTLVEMWDIL